MKHRSLMLLTVALATTACGGGSREDPILLLSASEALEIGKALLEEGKYHKARRHLNHAFEVEPNSSLGREALLLTAESLYLAGGPDNLIKCEAKYRDFLNRFPTSDRAAYAQFQVANCLAGRMEKPDRDQKVTEQALEAYEDLIRLYPTSPHVREAEEAIRTVTNNLAAHELYVGTFYIRYGICRAAIDRIEALRDDYPTFAEMDLALYHLARAYSKCRQPDQARQINEELQRQFPDSEYAGELAPEELSGR